MQNWIPPRFADLTERGSPGIFVCRVAGSRGRRLSLTRRSGARRPSARRSVASSPAAGDPLTMSRRAYDGDGSAVEFGDHCYR